MKIDLGAAREWLDLLHGDSTGFMHVCSTGNWEGLVCENTEQALGYIRTIDLRQPSGIYIRATTINTNQLLPGSRGSNKDTACLPGLWADVDVAGPGHKHDPTRKQGLELPPTFDDAVRIVVESGLPDPTLWINSGGGLYPWWLLREPVTIQDPEHLETVETLSEHWQMILSYSARQLGWHYGTETKDLARVLRIPGTINRKVPGSPVLCTLAANLGGGNTYSVDELFHAAITNLPKVQKPERTLPARVPGPGADDLSPGDALEQVPWDDPMLLGDWELHHQVGDVSYWTRPGKSRKDGYSATTGYDPARDRLYVFSSSTPLPTLEPLNKFAVYTELHHGGDFAAAAAELRRRGFGDRPSTEVAVPLAEPWEPAPPEGQTRTLRWSRFSWDDLGNAERFAFRYGDRVRWLIDAEQWALYQGGVWNQLTEGPIRSLTHQLIMDIPQLETELYSDEQSVGAKGKVEPSERDRFLSWTEKQRNTARIGAVIREAQGRPELHAKVTEFDRNPMLLGCLNGVLDLRTSELMPHSPGRMLMSQATVNWDESAECPRWTSYLEKTIPDPDERAYLQRITGYSLTGDVSEQALFIHFGFGANGKSVYLEVMGRILGDYSITVSSSTLMSKPYEGSHNADVARMAGKRLLRTSETNVGKRLDEGQVKLLTGGEDKVLARYPYQHLPFEFYPTGKIHLATNHAPNVSNADSIWRRIRLIGWDVKIETEERDLYLARKILADERSGVLNWAVQGCREWQQVGLNPPASSELRVLNYREDQDILGNFINDCVRDQPGQRTPSSDAYRVYSNWCVSMNIKPMYINTFVTALRERGYGHLRQETFRGFLDVTFVTMLQGQTGHQGDKWS